MRGKQRQCRPLRSSAFVREATTWLARAVRRVPPGRGPHPAVTSRPCTDGGHACLSPTGRNQNAKARRRSQLGVATTTHQLASCRCRRSSAVPKEAQTSKCAASVERAERLASPAVTMSTTGGRVAIAAARAAAAARGCRRRGGAALRKRRAARPRVRFELRPRGLRLRAPASVPAPLPRRGACSSSPSPRRCRSWRIKPVGHLGSRR